MAPARRAWLHIVTDRLQGAESVAPFTIPDPVMLTRSLFGLAFLIGSLGILVGCDSPNRETTGEENVSPAQQTAFRIRADAEAGLNADRGWAAGANEPATRPVEQPFRIRFEVETPAGDRTPAPFQLQVRVNDGDWEAAQARDFPYPSGSTPRVSIVSTPSYADSTATTDLLRGSGASFGGGTGQNLAAATPTVAAAGREGPVQTEWEWPVVIRRFADGAITTEEGDRFAFRMVDADGRPLGGAETPVVTATVPPRLLAGTYPETPGRLGPWETGEGSLYFLMEPAETYNVLMTVKSDDGGETWREVDGENRPGTGDLEGFASAFRDGTIHMLHQIDEGVLYHAFRTDAHDEGDAWSVVDDTLATPGEPPVQVTTLTARSDGSLVAVYGTPNGLQFSIRSPDGTWSDGAAIPDETGPVLSGPQSVLGAGDTVHLAYTRQDGTAWYRQIGADGRVTPARQVSAEVGTTEADVGSVLPLVHLPETNTTVIAYRKTNGTLWARRVGETGPMTDPERITDRQVVQNAVDSDQVGADAIAARSRVHVLFIENETGALYHTMSDARGEWTAPQVQVDTATVQWVRGQVLRRGEESPAVYGYVYDGGSNGGSGRNWYAEIPLTPEP